MNNNCNLTTCCYNQSGTCTNEDKREECVEVSKRVLRLEGRSCPDCHKSYDGVIIGGADEPKECECGCLFDLEGLFAGITCREPRYCENCKYWADNEICVNGYSEQVANFTDRDFSCKFYEREGKNGQKN